MLFFRFAAIGVGRGAQLTKLYERKLDAVMAALECGIAEYDRQAGELNQRIAELDRIIAGAYDSIF